VVLWEWMKACVRGSTSGQPGQWFYLVREVSMYDVSKLYRTLLQHIEIPNILMHGALVREFCDMKIKSGEDIFMYFSRLDEQVERVERMNYAVEEGLSITVPEWMIRWKIIETASNIPSFKFFFDNLRMSPPAKWSKMTKADLLNGLRTSQDNMQVIDGRQTRANLNIVEHTNGEKSGVKWGTQEDMLRRDREKRASNQAVGGRRADQSRDWKQPYQGRPRQRNQGGSRGPSRSMSRGSTVSPSRGRTPTGQCFQLRDKGVCSKQNCTYSHVQANYTPSRSPSASRSRERQGPPKGGTRGGRGRHVTPARFPRGGAHPGTGRPAVGTGAPANNNNILNRRRGRGGASARVVRATRVVPRTAAVVPMLPLVPMQACPPKVEVSCKIQ
jgi:hypothetical protein